MSRIAGSRRFVQLHLLTLLGALTAVGLLNLAADPFDYFRPALDGTLDPYKKRSATRYARANAVAAGNWDVVLCGASRTEIGFDPQHPAWEGRRVYNFGLVAAKYPEIWRASKFALESNPRLQMLWIELDPSYLIHKPPNGDFLNSRYAPHAEPVNYALGQLFGSLTSERSVSALSKWGRGEPADDYYTPHGLRVRPIRPPKAIAWDWFEKELDQTRAQRQSQAAAHQAFRGDPAALWLDLALLDDFPELVATARAQRTQVCVVVPPCHVVRLAQLIDEGWYAQVREFKRRMAGFVGDFPPLVDGRPALVAYDFLVDDEANAEPLPKSPAQDTQWHWEGGHFRVELGDRVLETIVSGPAAPPGTFGAQLTPQTIDEHLLSSDRALARRLPAIALLHERMDGHELARRLMSDDARATAFDADADARLPR